MIRAAILSDIAELIRFGAPFVRKLPGPPREPDEEACRQYLMRFIEAPQGALFVSERNGAVTGFICGIVVPDPFTGSVIGMKSSWLVDPARPGDGVKLLSHFEAWERDMGADRAITSCLINSPEIHEIYERRGYVQIEVKYERML